MPKASPSGKRGVIVANGPTVDDMGLPAAEERGGAPRPSAFWKAVAAEADCLLIGTNRVLCIESARCVRWHALVIRDGYRDLWHDQKWGARYHQQLWKPHPAWKVGPANERVTHCDEYVRPADGWQHERVLDHNREAAVMKNPSVALMAANWAWLQGCREIFLVGVDYRPGPDGRAHARMIPPYDTQEPGWAGQYAPQAVPERIEKYYRQAVAAVEAAGGSLLNLSPGSRLKAVPQADWQDVF